MKPRRLPTNIAASLLLLSLATSLACAADQAGEPASDPDTWDAVKEMYEKAKDAGEKVPQDVYRWAKQDLDRIGDWEYRVVEMPMSNAAAVQKRLNELGADRWECIWIHTQGDQSSFVFKRPTKSYLKNLPLSQLTKLVPRGGE